MRKGTRVRFNRFGEWVHGRVVDSYGSMLTVRAGDSDYSVHKSKVVRVRSTKRKNPAMTKKQRSARAKKIGSTRRKANAAKKMLIAMNPASKPKAVRIKRLKGGGVSITPVKVKVIGNPGSAVYAVVETKTGDVVSSHSTRREAVMAARSYGRGFKVVMFAGK